MTFIKYLLDTLKLRTLELLGLAAIMTVVAVVETVKIILVVPLLSYIFSQELSMAFEGSGFLSKVASFLKQISGFLGVQFSLGFILIFIIIVFILGALLRILQLHLQYKLRLKYMFSLSDDLLKSYFYAPWSFFIDNKPGKLVNVLSNVIPSAGLAFHHLCVTISSSIIVLLYVFLAVFVSWKLTCVILLMFPIFFILLKKLTHVTEKYGKENVVISNKLQADAFENILAAKMVKASGAEGASISAVKAIVQKSHHFYYMTMMSSGLMASIQEPMGIIILSVTIYLSLYFLNIPSQMILLILIIFFRLAPRFYELQRSYQQSLCYIPAFYEVDKMIIAAKSIQERSGERIFSTLKEGIEFKNVYFSYEKGKPVLEGVNLKIQKGQTIGVVGQSGSGKTTIADFVVGLIHPDKGEILIDNVPLQNYDYLSWRKSLGYVTQEMNLFHDTVRANITWNKKDAADEEIIKASKLGNSYEFIERMPNGYDTVIGDRGYKLSGGQRQRLALSRVILSNPQIYIFDEATSALDSESETKIQQSIDSLAATTTTLVIAHRISTLRNVDKIYVLEHGSVVESGSFNELMKKNGILKRLATMQSL